MGTGSFPGVKSGRDLTLTLHLLLVPWSRKSKAIPLLPLLAVRPVQSLSVCTRVDFTLLFMGGEENNTLEQENGNSEEILHVTNIKHCNEAYSAIHNYAMCNYKPLDDTN